MRRNVMNTKILLCVLCTLVRPVLAENGKMSKIAGGFYQPLYQSGENKSSAKITVHVRDFYLDQRPVSNSDFLQFVKLHNEYQKSNIFM